CSRAHPSLPSFPTRRSSDLTGYADLLLEDLAATDPRRQDADEIHKAADRAAGLTRQLLAFSRQQVLQPTVLEVNKLDSDLEKMRSEEHTSELQSRGHLVCRL